MATHIINVNMDQRCPRCHKRGAVNGGLCMNCIIKAIDRGERSYKLPAALIAWLDELEQAKQLSLF